MGQKVNPHGLRVGVIKDWDSRWFAGKATFGDTLVEDYKIRDYIMNKRMLTRANGEKSDQQLSRAAGIAQVEIERSSDNKIKIHILTAKPGMLIGAKAACIFQKSYEELHRQNNEVRCKGYQDNGKRPSWRC